MSGDARLVRALVACYPVGWRRRYGDEYAQLLCDMRVHRRPVLILDSLFGAVRAHGGVVVSRRSPMTAVVWATALFTVAGLGFAKLAEDFTGRAGSSYALLVAGAAVALLALAVAAAPTAAALIRGQDVRAWKYVAVPVVGAALWYGVLRLAQAIAGGHGVHTAPNVAGFALIAAAGIAVLAATAWAAVIVLSRVPGHQPARLRPMATTIVTAGMAVATIAAVIWGLQVRTAAGNHGGLLATPFVPSWIGVVVAFAAATALAARSSRRRPALAG
ncbi:hypothetical protein [Actinoplanes sp. NPDC051411]|uniref:hypothetical protein n=1 Tax=Actinoplanes sp. NPDC051411 TaxID=3155522 RepID=UPI003430DAB7